MGRTLIVMPSVDAVRDGDGFFLDRKAIEGLGLYARLWPGPVRCLFRAGRREAIAFGAHYAADALPFEIRIVPADAATDRAAFDDAAVILAAGDSDRDFGLAGALGLPVVYIIENTIATRLRIIRLSRGLSLKAARSALWELQTERRRRFAFGASAGLQCNGVPAYEAFRDTTPDALLYFDTRTTDAQQIGEAQLTAKHARMRGEPTLNLAFSGRLDPIKGVDHLVPVASALAGRGVDFRLDIFGDGRMRRTVEEQVGAAGLADRITVHGAVPFDDVLVPALIARTDLFLCCHRQGDPSCTYTETLSCGVPIVGYDNPAFAGIVSRADVGDAVPMNDIAAAADRVAALAADRERLVRLSANAAAFGREHSFEREFAKRVDQLRRIASV